jgi:hypothetical protein
MSVAIGRSFCTRTWTRSPTSRRSIGAGTIPLKVHASTTRPGSTSQSPSSIVRSKTNVPSVSTSVGSRSSLPTPSVSAGNAAIVASMASVIAW